uniref:Uncharacterized protein n=1 Tax=Tetranychus urticae TaxID=32264 RepID=T1KWE9_TETUR
MLTKATYSSGPESYSSISQMGDYGDMDSFKSTLPTKLYNFRQSRSSSHPSCQSDSIRDMCAGKGSIVKLSSQMIQKVDPTKRLCMVYELRKHIESSSSLPDFIQRMSAGKATIFDFSSQKIQVDPTIFNLTGTYWSTMRCLVSRLLHGGLDNDNRHFDGVKALFIVGDLNADIDQSLFGYDRYLINLITEFDLLSLIKYFDRTINRKISKIKIFQ